MDGGDVNGVENQASDAARDGRRPNVFRRLYDWVLSWAETRHGPAALGVLSFAESSFFPIPPDPLLMALALGAPRRALYFATICTAASVAGGIAGYAMGWGIWAAIDDFFFAYVPGVTPEAFESVRALYERWDFWAVFIAGFTPIPYKVFTLSSGVFGISFPVFIVASLVGRGLRFFLLAGLIYFFGPGIQGFIDRYFDRLVWLFFALLVGGFLLLEFVL
ncbi:MAG: YqaA family protein [Gemmatimonadota bacterium]|jgi:membrane protein YqaA with SNARE-associated domain